MPEANPSELASGDLSAAKRTKNATSQSPPFSGSARIASSLPEGVLKMIAKILVAAAATTFAVTPVVAAAAPTSSASSLSLAKSSRASSPVGKTNKAGAGSIAAIAIGLGIVGGITLAIVKDNDDDDSDSN